MHRLKSRSFWLSVFVEVASAWFVHVGKLDGSQWVTISGLVLGLWQAGDKAQQWISR